MTLVNAEINADGEIKESSYRTGRWAWRHPHKADGSVTYNELKGDVRLIDVDFAYEPGKPVLHDINIYAEPGQKVFPLSAQHMLKQPSQIFESLYDVDDGKIRYDGININKIKADLRRSLGMVLQDVNLLPERSPKISVSESFDATDEECIDRLNAPTRTVL